MISKVSLIDAFSPSLGDQFPLFQGVSGGSFCGKFSSFNDSLAPLIPGLAWDTSLLESNGILQDVNGVPEPATLLPLALVCGLFWRRLR